MKHRERKNPGFISFIVLYQPLQLMGVAPNDAQCTVSHFAFEYHISVSFCTQKLLQGLPRGKGGSGRFIIYRCSPALLCLFLSFAPPAESRISVPSYRNWQEGSFHDLFIVDLFGFKLSRRTLSLFFSLGSTKPFANVLDFGMVYFSKGWTFSRLD